MKARLPYIALLQLLKELRIDDNTLVLFSSDNGPSKESYLKDEPHEPTFFAGHGPFDGIKRDNLEGGVREPTFVRWPARIAGPRIDRTPPGLWDWLATFGDAAGIAAPATPDGVSLLPTLTGEGKQRRSALHIEYFYGQITPAYADFAPAHRGRDRKQMQTVMVDQYVGVRCNFASVEDDFEIFDVEKDPHQAHNPSAEPGMTEIQVRSKARALQARRPDPEARRPYDSALVPAVTPPQVKVEKIRFRPYTGPWAWVPDYQRLHAVREGTVDRIDAIPAAAQPGSGVAFDGYFPAEADGDYTFFERSDGGAEIFFHDARVIDDDFGRSVEEVSLAIHLAKGWHPLRVFYRHAEAEAHLTLHYSGPGIERRRLPARVLASVR